MGIYIDGPETFSDIKSILRRRGHLPIRQGASTDTLFPEEKIGKMIDELGKEEYRRRFPTNIRDSYYELFGRASFRKMVRRLLRDDRQWTPSADLVGMAGSAATEYLNYLENLQVLERNGDRVRVSRPISNIGPSLEHYVAQVCIRELRGSAEWGVVLEELPRSGGDYDVLAWLEPSLIYIECKSGQVANISKSELREFFQRTVELAPDLAIFLVDTEDDLTTLVSSKMNPILSDAVPSVLGTYKPIRPLTDYPRASYGFDRIYVTNSKKTILAQIRRCLQHYYAHVKGGSDWSEGAVNYIGVPVRDQS